MKIVSYVDGPHLYVKCTQIQPRPPIAGKEDVGRPTRRECQSPILAATNSEHSTAIVDQITFNQISAEDIDSLIASLLVAKEKHAKHLTKTGQRV